MMVLTAARPKGRQAAVLLTYEKTDISEEIAPDLESFKYTDVAESKSDSVSITVNAKAAKWKNDWMPEKGVKLYPAIVVKDWNIGGIESGYRDYSAECGAFVLDDLSFAGGAKMILPPAIFIVTSLLRACWLPTLWMLRYCRNFTMWRVRWALLRPKASKESCG